MKLAKVLLLVATSLSLVSCNKTKDNLYEGTDPATILDGYYKDLESWENYLDLRQKLYNIISKDFTAIPYTTHVDGSKGANWETNRAADQSLYDHDKVHLLYSDNEDFKVKGNSTNWQREHCFPASLMTGKSTGDAVKTIGTATDFHNLYASYSSGNSIHSNNSFGYVNPNNGVEIKKVGNSQYQEDNPATTDNEAVFEPADIDKGRVARAVFYIGLMYGKESWVKTTDSEGHELSTGIEIVTRASKIPCTLQSAEQGLYKCHSNSEDLIEWCRKFWPDRLEYQHTSYVQTLQHNRNPFVDFPELVEYAFGEKMTEPGELKNLHNIYDILDLGNDSVNNIAIGNVKHSYDAGDVYNSHSDIEVYEVKNDLTAEKISDYTINGVEDNKALTTASNGKYITVSKGDAKSVTYPIYVASEAWKDVNYVGLPTYDLVKQKTDPEMVTLNGVTWNFSSKAKSTDYLDELGEDIGVVIGSGSSPAETLTIETNSTMEFDEKTLVKAIYVEANTTSSYNGNFDVKIELNDNVVYTKAASHSRYSNFESFGVSLAESNQGVGKIKITIENLNTGLRLGRIGVVVDSIE